MIDVQHLTKRYGQHMALDGVSFSVNAGEVVGFLGPNGAGKSTTMRILTTFMAATSGTARVGGDCVFEQPDRVRERIGYMPENNPLPLDLRVADYLGFRAELKHLAKREAVGRVSEVMEQCGIADVAKRFIGQLSRGYRQRVGLAQALVHQPDVLVLDEPTSGLDPAQRKEIRELLIELAAGERTVILSTHVLSEVEAVCERVVIIEKGQIITQDSIESLRGASNQVRLEVARPGAAITNALSAVDSVTSVREESGGIYIVSASTDRREQLAAAAVPAGLLAMGQAEQLEDIYLRLTQGDSQ